MSLLPDTASFHERVQALFVAYRGKGVSLSADDLDLVDAWAKAEVPFEVVARGIRVAAERALFDAPTGQGQLRFLKACRRTVDAEQKKYLKLSAGQTGATKEHEPLPVARHRKLVGVLKRLVKQQPTFEGPLSKLLRALEVPADFETSARQEALALAVLCRALPFSERLELLHAASARTVDQQLHSRAARLESRRLHRDALLRRKLGLSAFW